MKGIKESRFPFVGGSGSDEVDPDLAVWVGRLPDVWSEEQRSSASHTVCVLCPRLRPPLGRDQHHRVRLGAVVPLGA
jgi:hypothetical protein